MKKHRLLAPRCAECGEAIRFGTLYDRGGTITCEYCAFVNGETPDPENCHDAKDYFIEIEEDDL